MISLGGQTDTNDEEIAIEEGNGEKVEVGKSDGGNMGKNGKALMRSSQEGSLEGAEQNKVSQPEGVNLPFLVKLSS